MTPKIELKQIRDLGQIIDDSIAFFKQNFKQLLRTYFTICGVFLIAGAIVSVFTSIQNIQHARLEESIFTWTYFLGIALDLLNFFILTITGLSFITIYHEKGKVAPSVDEVWAYFKFYFFRVAGSGFLLALGLGVSFLFCILPCIYFYPIFMLFFPIMIIENASLGYSFSRTFQLIKNNWWHTLGTLFVMGLVVAAVMLLCMIPILAIVAVVCYFVLVDFSQVYTVVFAVSIHLLQFLYLLPIISIALVYFSLNELKDDQNILERINMIGIAHTHTDELPSEEY